MILPVLLGSLVLKPRYETLFFVKTDCPIAKRYTPEMKRIMKDFKGVSGFRFVYEDSLLNKNAIENHHHEYNIKAPFLLDKDHALAKKYKVAAVPTAVVVSTSGEVQYSGRIDDAYGANFKWRTPEQLDLRNALDAIEKGKPVPVKTTPVTGCTISF